MNTLFGIVGCIPIFTPLPACQASRAFAGLLPADDTFVEVYRNRPCASDEQVDATERLDTRLSNTDTVAAPDELVSKPMRVGGVSWHHTMWRRCRMGVAT